MKKLFVSLAVCLTAALDLFGHASGENYLFLEFLEDSIRGRVEFHVRDIEEKLGQDLKVGGEYSEKRIQDTQTAVTEYILKNLQVSPAGESPYSIKFDQATFFANEGGWAQYPFTLAAKPVPAELEIELTTLFEDDLMHRAIVVTEKGVWPSEDYQMNIAMVFSQGNSTQILDTQNPPTVQTPSSMIWQGILHIWIGIDHILFLVALALPIVLTRQGNVWKPAEGLGSTLWSLLKVVTIFTIAHSITLALASLGFIQLPSRLVESVIALSIILIAVNNFIGRSNAMSFLVILFLGLFHGLGFASVMSDLPFRIAELQNFLLIILAFNFGVELGQLAILLVLFPIIFALRKTPIYTPVILKGGSVILILIAGYWFVERAFAL